MFLSSVTQFVFPAMVFLGTADSPLLLPPVFYEKPTQFVGFASTFAAIVTDQLTEISFCNGYPRKAIEPS